MGSTVITRRQFGLTIGAGIFAPIVARAQQPAMPVIGFLSGRSPTDSAVVVEAFRQGVKEVGFIDGQNVAFEYRWADGDFGQLPALADELVRRPVDVLATAGGTAAALAAKAATKVIPIVFITGDDPVRAGLVASLNRPDGNLTGVTLSGTEVAAKRLALLRELVPRDSLMAVLMNPTSPIAETQSSDVKAASRTMDLKLSFVSASNDAELEPAFTLLAQQRAGALFVPQDAFYLSRRVRIAALAARHGIPATYESRDFADVGGLMSYGTNLASMYHQIGVYAGDILKGGKPGDLPVMRPTKFELVLNLKTAKALGLEIPPTLLALADEVIE